MQSYVLLSEHKDKEESFHHRKNISPKNMQKNCLNIRIFSHIPISENIFYEEKYFKTYFFEKKCPKENNVLKKSISLHRFKKTT